MEMYNLNVNVITAAGITVMVFLALFGIIVWNNRTKVQSETLKSIDSKIKEVKEIEENIQEIEEKTLETVETTVVERVEEDMESKTKEEVSCAKEDPYRTGKSGKVYSEEELIELIKE